MAPDKMLSRLLGFPILLVLGFLGFIPIMFPIFSQYEGRIFPVVSRVNVQEFGEADTGIFITLSFDKIRACEFLGINWFDQFGDRLPILFEVGAGELPTTRPVLDNQQAGPWKLIGIDNLESSVAIVSHRCHPLWITYTPFYP